jgi:hypothetical protein
MDNLKERFFAQYWGLECGANKFGSRGIPILPSFFTMVEYLELKPSKSLTREEADYINHELGKMGDVSVTAAFDYARSLGYLVPFMGMSEDDLVEQGWVKIIE